MNYTHTAASATNLETRGTIIIFLAKMQSEQISFLSAMTDV